MLKFILTSLFILIFSFSVSADHNSNAAIGDIVGVAFMCTDVSAVDYVLNEAEKDNAEKALTNVLTSGACIQSPGLVGVRLVEKGNEYLNIDKKYVFIAIKVVDKRNNFYYSFMMEEKGKES